MSCRFSARREFLRSSAVGVAAGVTAPYWICAAARGEESKNDRPLVGAIGVGGRGLHIAQRAAQFGDIVAVCDADLGQAEKAKAALGGKAEIYQDYRRLLERKDIEVIVNGTPDHWHTAINIAACRSGKDLYAEKPLTLTIDEGKRLCRAVRETGRIVQVGTQQRSVPHFRTAVELVRGGAIGKLRLVSVILPFWNTRGGPFATKPVPAELDWDLYQGQAPWRQYCRERTHFTFRWFFEYAGGIITDWGQHHMDIAHWGMDVERSGPLTVEGKAYFPNEGRPGCDQCFNNPDRFVVKMTYPGDIDLWYFVARDAKYLAEMGDLTPEQEAALFAGLPDDLKAEQRNGILFVGDKGRIFVNRGGAYGKAVEEHCASHPAQEPPGFDDTLEHMRNFFDSVKSRQQPITDVEIAHRTITACHLGNIALRLKRKITWDAATEQIVGDDEANARQQREQRAPYAIEG